MKFKQTVVAGLARVQISCTNHLMPRGISYGMLGLKPGGSSYDECDERMPGSHAPSSL